MRVDTVLTELLNATAAKAAASRRVDRLRDVLDTEARRRYVEEGAAPSWKAPSLGTVRLDPKPAAAYITDPDAFASYVAERVPSEVTATIAVPAATLEAALEALAFAGIPDVTAKLDVRPTFAKAMLEAAEVLWDDEPEARAVMRRLDDAGTVEPIPGTGVLAPGATLVVTLDPARKARSIAEVDADFDADTVSLEQAVALADQPADALERAVVEELTPDPAGSLAERQRAHASAHAAKIGDDLRAFAERGTGAVRVELDSSLPVGVAELRDETGQTVGRITGIGEPDLGAVKLGHAVQVTEEYHATALAAQAAIFGDPADAPAAEGIRYPSAAEAPLDRDSYVGDGADGARRSAEIDRSEADGLAFTDPRRSELLASAERWDAQAERLDALPVVTPEQVAATALDEADGLPAGSIPLADQVAIAGAALKSPTEVDLVAVDLAKLLTDDLKRAARRRRLPVSGSKVLLASRLAKAGVTPADVLAEA